VDVCRRWGEHGVQVDEGGVKGRNRFRTREIQKEDSIE